MAAGLIANGGPGPDQVPLERGKGALDSLFFVKQGPREISCLRTSCFGECVERSGRQRQRTQAPWEKTTGMADFLRPPVPAFIGSLPVCLVISLPGL